MVAPSRKDEIAAQARAILAAREATKKAKSARRMSVNAVVESPKHKPLPSSWQREYGLVALCREARRRGTTYGKLCARLTPAEQDEIVREYAEEQQLKRKKH